MVTLIVGAFVCLVGLIGLWKIVSKVVMFAVTLGKMVTMFVNMLFNLFVGLVVLTSILVFVF